MRKAAVSFLLAVMVGVSSPPAVSARAAGNEAGTTKPIAQELKVGTGNPFPDLVWAQGEYVYVSLSVSAYSQKNSLWSSDTMETTTPSTCSGCTIGSSGCLLTSVAMVFRFYGHSETPATLNEDMGIYACPFYFFTADDYSGGTATFYDDDGGLWSFSYYNLVSFLNAGWPPVVEHERWDGTNWRTHWVCFKKCDGDWEAASSYWLIDPNGGQVKRYDTFLSEKPWQATQIAAYQRN